MRDPLPAITVFSKMRGGKMLEMQFLLKYLFH